MPKTTDNSEPLQFLTVADVARRFQVTERTVRSWYLQGELRVHKIRGAIRIAPEDLDDFISKERK